MKPAFRYDRKTNRIVPTNGRAITATNARDNYVGERQYENMRHTDGTDISSRKKHRAFMRERNLTTIDDFTSGFPKQPTDKVTHADIASAVRDLQNGYKPRIQREGE